MSGSLAIESGALLDGLTDAVVIADLEGVIRYVNPAASALLGAARDTIVGGSLSGIVPERLRDRHAAAFTSYRNTGEGQLIGGRPVRLPVLRADGTEAEIELSLSAHRTAAGEEIVLGTLRNLDERLALERQRAVSRYLATSRDVMTRLAVGASAATLEEAAPVLLETLGEGLRWDGGAVWELRQDARLHPIAMWSPDGDGTGAAMTLGWTFGVGEGLPGSVVADADAMWLEAVAASEVFVRQDEAAQAGIRSCFAFPVLVAGDVVGVIEMYSREVQPPEPELLAILQSAGLEIGRFLERALGRRHLMEMAETLQASLLPPHTPDVPGLDIAVRYRAAGGEGQIGGDFFDVFPLPDGEWAVLIGDVSGRGPRAAALTALARYTLRAAAIGSPGPSSVLAVLNDVVRRELDGSADGAERFLTVAYLTISPNEDGFDVTIACGGHPSPLARRSDGTVDVIPCEGDLIGAFDVHESVNRTTHLGPEDVVVLVTDGVLEARNGSDQFGEDRLQAVLASCSGTTASDYADAIEAAVLSYLDGHTQDDLAIVVLRLPAVGAPAAHFDVRAADIAS